MSLIHSLTVAESLQTPRTAPGRFRMAQHNLPKFAAAKAPISLRPAPPPRTETAPGETGSLFDPRHEPKALEVRVSAASVIHATTSVLSPAANRAKPVEPAGSGAAAPPKTSAKKPRGSRIFRDVPWWGGRPGGAREREVQTEWALDRVTVVRNDLSETDLEVVTTRREEAMEGPFALKADRSEGSAKPGWWRRVRSMLRLWK